MLPLARHNGLSRAFQDDAAIGDPLILDVEDQVEGVGRDPLQPKVIRLSTGAAVSAEKELLGLFRGEARARCGFDPAFDGEGVGKLEVCGISQFNFRDQVVFGIDDAREPQSVIVPVDVDEAARAVGGTIDKRPIVPAEDVPGPMAERIGVSVPPADHTRTRTE